MKVLPPAAIRSQAEPLAHDPETPPSSWPSRQHLIFVSSGTAVEAPTRQPGPFYGRPPRSGTAQDSISLNERRHAGSWRAGSRGGE